MTNEEDFICAGPPSKGHIQTNTRYCLMLKLNEDEQGYTGDLKHRSNVYSTDNNMTIVLDSPPSYN
jgi:hypothetical protein